MSSALIKSFKLRNNKSFRKENSNFEIICIKYRVFHKNVRTIFCTSNLIIFSKTFSFNKDNFTLSLTYSRRSISRALSLEQFGPLNSRSKCRLKNVRYHERPLSRTFCYLELFLRSLGLIYARYLELWEFPIKEDPV